MESGAIPILVDFLDAEVPAVVQKNAAMAMYTLSAHSNARNVILAAGGKSKLSSLASTSLCADVRSEAEDALGVLNASMSSQISANSPAGFNGSAGSMTNRTSSAFVNPSR